ncbi:hypothetical protein [Curtobacterium sp. RRHDQ10]|uniref:hypothetical protein n=1 Tax=Curtobacterium phyllosphaerae TaxID=3413379 RepID=UPI003BF3457A
MRWLVGITLGAFAAVGAAGTVPLDSTAGPSVLVDAAVGGGDLAPVVLGIAGLVYIASDLGSGAIGTTLILVPSRRAVLAAKLIAVALLALCVTGGTVVIALVLAVITSARLGGIGLGGTDDWLSAAVRLCSVFVCHAFLGAGVGLLLATTAGAIAAYLSAVFALPLLIAIAGIWLADVARQLLASMPAMLTTRVLHDFPPGMDLLRFLLIDLVVVVLGAVRMVRKAVR